MANWTTEMGWRWWAQYTALIVIVMVVQGLVQLLIAWLVGAVALHV